MDAAQSSGRQAWAYLLLILSPLFMASNVVFGRDAVETVPPIGLAFWRWVLAFAILLPFAWPGLRRHGTSLLRAWPLLLVLGALGMGVCGAFVYIGLQHTTATHAGLIYAASPIFILIIGAVFIGERLSLIQCLGVVLAVFGVVVILTHGAPQQLLSFRVNVGDVWVLVATVAWAVYSVLLKRKSLSVPTIPLFAAIALAGVICLAPFYVWETLAGRPVVPTTDALTSVLAVAFIASVLAFGAYQQGIAVIGPSRAGMFMYLMPVYAALLAIVFLGERFELFHLVGLGFILPGLVLATLVPRWRWRLGRAA
ncbi:MAG: DMT family transporter [Pseudomonadota bacterium]